MAAPGNVRMLLAHVPVHGFGLLPVGFIAVYQVYRTPQGRFKQCDDLGYFQNQVHKLFFEVLRGVYPAHGKPVQAFLPGIKNIVLLGQVGQEQGFVHSHEQASRQMIAHVALDRVGMFLGLAKYVLNFIKMSPCAFFKIDSERLFQKHGSFGDELIMLYKPLYGGVH